MVDRTADIHAAITLSASPQSITTAITAPNAPRCLSITGSKAGSTLTGTVTLTGTDEDGNAISEALSLNGNATVFGRQVFASVTTIAVPARVTAADAVKVGVADRLFDVATARAFDKLQLANDDTFPDAAILAREEELREFFESICGVNMLPTLHTNETHSGDGSATLITDWPRPLAVTAAATRSEQSWTAFSSDELAHVVVASEPAGVLYREEGSWPAGVRNVRVSYVAGYQSVPELVQRAALMALVTELPTSNIPFSAEAYDAGGMAVSFSAGDGYNGAWHRIAEVRRAIRLYSHRVAGIV